MSSPKRLYIKKHSQSHLKKRELEHIESTRDRNFEQEKYIIEDAYEATKEVEMAKKKLKKNDVDSAELFMDEAIRAESLVEKNAETEAVKNSAKNALEKEREANQALQKYSGSGKNKGETKASVTKKISRAEKAAKHAEHEVILQETGIGVGHHKNKSVFSPEKKKRSLSEYNHFVSQHHKGMKERGENMKGWIHNAARAWREHKGRGWTVGE